MDSTHTSAILKCPECGAELARGAAQCWLCRAPIAASGAAPEVVLATAVDEPANPYRAPQPSSSPQQFRLSTLLLSVTVVALCVGLYRVAPGLIVVLLIFAVPALVRTASKSRRAAELGMPMSAGEKVASFLAGVGIVLLVLVGLCIAFFLACLAMFSSMNFR